MLKQWQVFEYKCFDHIYLKQSMTANLTAKMFSGCSEWVGTRKSRLRDVRGDPGWSYRRT